MLSTAPSPVLTFEKVLRAFGTGSFTYADVAVELERLLAIGASPTAMLETLQRRDRIEPFPEFARVEVVRLLNAAIAMRANGAVASRSQFEPEVQDQSPEAELSDMRDTLAARNATIAQMLNSLGERDAQLAALQQQYAKSLEARANASARLESESRAAQRRYNALSTELATARAALQLEQNKSKDHDKARADSVASVEAARLSADQALLEAKRYQEDSQSLREALAAREVSIAQIKHSLSEREAQLAALQQEHAKIVPMLKARANDARSEPGVHRRRQSWSIPLIARPLMAGAAVALLAAVAWFLFQHESTTVPHASAPREAPLIATTAVPEAGTVIRDCPTCPAMVVLPKGRFEQGSLRAGSGSAFETPLHWVAIGPLSMSTNAVTVEDFQQFIADTGSDMSGCDIYDGDWKHRADNSWENPGFPQTGTHPVTCVSWNDAKAYAQWLSTKTGHSYRLPSASEWEYAARAGGEAVQPWGTDGSAACATANVADAGAAQQYPGWSVFGCNDGYVYTAPVGSFKANAFGLNDMLGNVFQWTEDCWHADYTGAPIDGSARSDGDCSEHELRGGSWFSTPAYVRANYRNHFAADYRTSSVGIRLVRDLGS